MHGFAFFFKGRHFVGLGGQDWPKMPCRARGCAKARRPCRMPGNGFTPLGDVGMTLYGIATRSDPGVPVRRARTREPQRPVEVNPLCNHKVVITLRAASH